MSGLQYGILFPAERWSCHCSFASDERVKNKAFVTPELEKPNWVNETFLDHAAKLHILGGTTNQQL
jgi:hypothetical protein